MAILAFSVSQFFWSPAKFRNETHFLCKYISYIFSFIKKPCHLKDLTLFYTQSYVSHVLWAQIILCLVTLELRLPDMYCFVVFLLWQKTNLTIFKRNCFTLVLRILITIIPAAVLSRQQNIYASCYWLNNSWKLKKKLFIKACGASVSGKLVVDLFFTWAILGIAWNPMLKVSFGFVSITFSWALAIISSTNRICLL